MLLILLELAEGATSNANCFRLNLLFYWQLMNHDYYITSLHDVAALISIV